MIYKNLTRLIGCLSILTILTASCSEKIPEFYGDYIFKTRWVDTVSVMHKGGLDGVRLYIEGTDTPMELTSDADGMFYINDLKWGVYSFEISREGFTSQLYENYKLFGPESDTLTRLFSVPLYQISTRKIRNFNLIPSETYPHWNSYDVPDEVFEQLLPNQALWVFVDTLPDVNFNQYLQYNRGNVKYENSELRNPVQVNQQLANKTCYAVAYISSAVYSQYGYTGVSFEFGTPSDIFTFQPTE